MWSLRLLLAALNGVHTTLLLTLAGELGLLHILPTGLACEGLLAGKLLATCLLNGLSAGLLKLLPRNLSSLATQGLQWLLLLQLQLLLLNLQLLLLGSELHLLLGSKLNLRLRSELNRTWLNVDRTVVVVVTWLRVAVVITAATTRASQNIAPATNGQRQSECRQHQFREELGHDRVPSVSY